MVRFRVIVSSLLLLFMAGLYGGGEALAQESDWPTSSLSVGSPADLVGVGEDAPAFSLRAYNEEVPLRLVKSPQVSLSFFVGLRPEFQKKVVLLGFFATWNEKSRAELATFQKLYKKFKDDGVMVLMVSLDNKEIYSVYEAIEKDKVTYPVLRDRFSIVARRYGIAKLPTLLIIDRDGKVVSLGEGYQDNVEAYVEQEIRNLLQGG